MTEELAAAADFISIGTNDLTQYVLAADRGNAQVGSIYDPLHPAVVRLVHSAVAAARRRRTPVSACGELAADVRGVLLFVGMGVSELSVSPSAVPRTKALVRRFSAASAGALVEEVMKLQTGSAIAARLHTAAEELDVRTDAREARDAR
jgi:phosphoenolpyruvate-protein kinase (PTS system EI component)